MPETPGELVRPGVFPRGFNTSYRLFSPEEQMLQDRWVPALFGQVYLSGSTQGVASQLGAPGQLPSFGSDPGKRKIRGTPPNILNSGSRPATQIRSPPLRCPQVSPTEGRT